MLMERIGVIDKLHNVAIIQALEGYLPSSPLCEGPTDSPFFKYQDECCYMTRACFEKEGT